MYICWRWTLCIWNPEENGFFSPEIDQNLSSQTVLIAKQLVVQTPYSPHETESWQLRWSQRLQWQCFERGFVHKWLAGGKNERNSWWFEYYLRSHASGYCRWQCKTQSFKVASWDASIATSKLGNNAPDELNSSTFALVDDFSASPWKCPRTHILLSQEEFVGEGQDQYSPNAEKDFVSSMAIQKSRDVSFGGGSHQDGHFFNGQRYLER